MRLHLTAALAALLFVPATAFAQEVKLDEKELETLTADAAKMAAAKKKYTQTCAACHGPKGAGMIGPNLTDTHFIKGGSAQAIANAIAQGSPKKGMPAMAPMLGQDGVKLLTAYVLTLKGQNLPGKGPEGTPEK